MPSYIVSVPLPLPRHILLACGQFLTASKQIKCKSSATDEEIQTVKDQAVQNGGTITHEYKLIKGFAYVASFQTCSLPFESSPVRVLDTGLD
ncbi:hypothetical protein BJX63DRAFT_428818 [Aspergillus granulosus]|uniref:Inhibitor I9 domain-containing protein n=1 Tax=Aspergillus granulosus TaxID=176169 RepID=A0ABR4HVR1_9EURO